MMRIARIWVLIAVGAAVTVGSAMLGLAALGQRLHECPHAAKDGQQPYKRITIGPSGLRYFEGDNVLTLNLEMTPRYDIVYVPTSRRWPGRMPDWARHRRDDIIVEIKRLASGHPIHWVDDDT